MVYDLKLGVDISKDWFNYCLVDSKFNILIEGKVINKEYEIDIFIEQLIQSHEGLSHILLVLEHTGIYIQNLTRSWFKYGGNLSVVHASNVSEHLGGSCYWQEKTDEIDARRLAEFGVRFEDKLKLWHPESLSIKKLQVLQRLRSRIIAAINLLAVPMNELKEYEHPEIYKAIQVNQKKSLTALNSDLKKIEQELQTTVEQDENLTKLFKLIQSVEGIGPVTAREVIISTGGFRDFLPNQAKSYSRYCGVIPVKKESGKNIKKGRISKRCNKQMKKLLTMGAMSLIKTDKELGIYYRRKINNGKEHMCVINAMRNKLILRIFAVVRNQVMYQNNLNISLD